jgi:glutathione reductase (NADPH)
LSERQRPGAVTFLGGGVVALEFAHVYARAGTKVAILEPGPHILAHADQDAVAQIRAESERIGIEIHTGITVQRVEKAGARLRTFFEAAGEERVLEADRVVSGAAASPMSKRSILRPAMSRMTSFVSTSTSISGRGRTLAFMLVAT